MIRPLLARHHLGREGADGVGGAVQIVVDDIAPVGVLHLQQRLPALDRGIGDHDVDLAVVAVRPDRRARAARRCRGCRRVIACAAPAIALDLPHGLVQFLRRGRLALEAGDTGPAISTPTTSAPLAANSTAMARPMPRAAPVTTATLPVNCEPRPGRTGPALCSAWALASVDR